MQFESGDVVLWNGAEYVVSECNNERGDLYLDNWGWVTNSEFRESFVELKRPVRPRSNQKWLAANGARLQIHHHDNNSAFAKFSGKVFKFDIAGKCVECITDCLPEDKPSEFDLVKYLTESESDESGLLSSQILKKIHARLDDLLHLNSLSENPRDLFSEEIMRELLQDYYHAVRLEKEHIDEP